MWHLGQLAILCAVITLQKNTEVDWILCIQIGLAHAALYCTVECSCQIIHCSLPSNVEHVQIVMIRLTGVHSDKSQCSLREFVISHTVRL